MSCPKKGFPCNDPMTWGCVIETAMNPTNFREGSGFLPIGSMGLAYLPTFTIKISQM